MKTTRVLIRGGLLVAASPFLFACSRLFSAPPAANPQTPPAASPAVTDLQQLPQGIAPVSPDVPEAAKLKFTPRAIWARELAAQQGKVQSNEDWMWPQAAYTLLSPSFKDRPGGTKTKITNVAHLMGNNDISFYRFPWQAWQETVPASRLSDGLGINLNVPDSLLPAAIKQLKAMGVTKWRMDIGWGNVDYSNPAQLRASVKTSIATRIALCRQAGLRPLFCLDTNPAAPCPIGEASVTLLQPVKAGDTSVLVKPRSGEVPLPWKSGVSHVTAYWAAEYLATSVKKEGDGYRVHFAKPWPKDHDKATGATLPYAYLAFRPFSNDNSPESERTKEGFITFVKAVASFMETQGLRVSQTDPGYDIEYLNENSNGQFFHLNWYAPGQKDGAGSELALYKHVVQTLRSDPGNDAMTIINGYWNQLPPAPGSAEPAGSNGGSSHFYQAEVKEKTRQGVVEDAFGRSNSKGFIPDVVLHAPEVIFSAYKFEHLSRVMAPFPVELWGSTYGRGIQPRTGPKGKFSNPVALEPSGKPARPTHWYQTEWGDAQWGPQEERERRNAKYVLRGTVFALSKGIERVYWYSAADASLGLLTFDLKKLPAKEPLTVTTMTRLHTLLGGEKITKKRDMPCVRISENHGHIQFKGNGTLPYPDLPNRDILFTQSFQLSDTDLMACVYVPTLNYETDLPDETYTVRWRGVKWSPASEATYHDLRDGQEKIVKPSAVGADWVEFTLPVCDWPRFVKMTNV